MKPQEFLGKPDGLQFENQSEFKHLRGIIDAYESLTEEGSKYTPSPFVEGVSSDEDLALAKEFATESTALIKNFLWQGAYPPEITASNGARLPDTLGRHPGSSLNSKQLSEFMPLVLLVALQPTRPVAEMTESEIWEQRHSDHVRQRRHIERANEIVGDAVLAAELMLSHLTPEAIDHMQWRQNNPERADYVPFGELLDRYFESRGELLPLAQERAENYRLRLGTEFRNAAYGDSMLLDSDAYPRYPRDFSASPRAALVEYITRHEIIRE